MYNGRNFMAFLLKLNLLILSTGLCFGVVCFYLGRGLIGRHESQKSISQDLFNQIYLITLKAMSLIYFAGIFILAFSLVIFGIYSVPYILALPIEISAGLLAVIAVFALWGILAMPVAFRRPIEDNSVFLTITQAAEPVLFQLADELADHFNMPAIADIRITPGAEIQIKEDVYSIDDVFNGGSKRIEIGFSCLQFLTTSDLKVLLARQFSFFRDGDQSLGVIVNRLNRRLQLITDNLLMAGFIYTFNPVFLFAYSGQSLISYVTRDCLLLAEIDADESTAEFSGTNRLKNALARYNVEIENHRAVIEAVDHRLDSGYESLGNIYDVIRNSHREPIDRISEMARYMFSTDDRKQEGIKQSLKLRLKRLPETLENTFEAGNPAYDYLSDWKMTENRMMDAINKETYY